MKAKALILAAVLLSFLGYSQLLCTVPAAAAHPPAAPQLPRDFSGGRPGHFRFQPQEQIQADGRELAELRAGIERLRGDLPYIQDSTARVDLKLQLERWQVHLDRVQRELSSSAGPTASEVEQRLDSIKGSRSCSVCHGASYAAELTMSDR